MADNTTGAAAKMADQPQQDCPLMKLPVELRLRIYKFAFEDMIYDIVADAANKKQMYQEADKMWPSLSNSKADYPVFFGVLSFLHASRELRRESLDALLAPTRAFKAVCSGRFKAATKASRIPVRDEHGKPQYFKDVLRDRRLRNLEANEAWYRLQRMELVCNTIALVVKNTVSNPQRKLVRSKQRRR